MQKRGLVPAEISINARICRFFTETSTVQENTMRLRAAGLGLFLAFSLSIDPAMAEPASVIRGEECSLTANETTYITSRTLRIVTKSANNVVIWTCKFDIPDYTGGLFQDRGFPCLVETGAGPVLTSLSQATISPAGKGTLLCRVKSSE